jgi:hypothetical protein
VVFLARPKHEALVSNAYRIYAHQASLYARCSVGMIVCNVNIGATVYFDNEVGDCWPAARCPVDLTMCRAVVARSFLRTLLVSASACELQMGVAASTCTLTALMGLCCARHACRQHR